MAYKYKEPRTFKQKVKDWTRKTLLTAAFTGAAAAPSIHYFGTSEDIVATVISVDANFTVHTDKGVFANHPTYMHFKNEKDVLAIDRFLQPGQTVKLTVYGFDPRINSFSLDSLGIHRNISDASKIAPAILSTPMISPPGSSGTDVTDDTDTMAPGMSEDNSNIAGITQKMPQLAHDLALMASLPITGKPVYDILKDPANRIRTSLVATPLGIPASAAYSDRRLRVPRNTGTSSVFHEAFHAAQDVNEGRDDNMFSLTQKDAVIANLLTEAVAVAYELASRQEARNHGLSFKTRDSSVIGAADKQGNIDAFNKAYNKAWGQNASLSAQERETKSLEAGGQAVVRLLLAGGDRAWTQGYTQLVVGNINNNLSHFKTSGNDPKYPAQRDKVFSKQGNVLPGLQFVPPEYLGPDAPQYIEQCYETMGFTIKTAALFPAKTKNPVRALS